jgi:hypothetical protein
VKEDLPRDGIETRIRPAQTNHVFALNEDLRREAIETHFPQPFSLLPISLNVGADIVEWLNPE